MQTKTIITIVGVLSGVCTITGIDLLKIGQKIKLSNISSTEIKAGAATLAWTFIPCVIFIALALWARTGLEGKHPIIKIIVLAVFGALLFGVTYLYMHYANQSIYPYYMRKFS